MTPEEFLDLSETVATRLLALAGLLTLLRFVRGPSLADRILSLDMLTLLAVSIVVLVALRTGVFWGVDIAVALCLAGFVSTVALARFLLSHPESAKGPQTAPEPH
ncbi:MAG: monovalent cation/H+ antiporter complex subunit F [Devosia sp.]